jgi:hypothetical protein
MKGQPFHAEEIEAAILDLLLMRPASPLQESER